MHIERSSTNVTRMNFAFTINTSKSVACMTRLYLCVSCSQHSLSFAMQCNGFE